MSMGAPLESGLMDKLRAEPSALAFMAAAMLPRRRPGQVPPIGISLAPARAARSDLDAFAGLTGTRAPVASSLLWPQVWTFRLQMALLTDRRFGLPIWSALQVRNRIWQLEPRRPDGDYERRVVVAAARQLDKGVEVDLRATLHRGGADPVWIGVTTFYWRSRRIAPPMTPSLPALPAQVLLQPEGRPLARWRTAGGGGWRFGALTGDYNGLHWSDAYARRFGFERAFLHPGRAAAQCLAGMELPLSQAPQRLDLWIRGPVYRSTAVTLLADDAQPARRFGLLVDGDPRPALLGLWTSTDEEPPPGP